MIEVARIIVSKTQRSEHLLEGLVVQRFGIDKYAVAVKYYRSKALFGTGFNAAQ